MLEEAAGSFAGMLAAPAFAAGAILRRGRFLHAEGVCFQASVTALPTPPPLAAIGKRLSGSALVRLSSGLWRGGKEWPDLLGCSIRFGLTEPGTGQAANDAQDLLCITLPKLWLLAVAPMLTRTHDFLSNSYDGGGLFEIDEMGLVKLELCPQPTAQEQGATRLQKLCQAVATGTAAFVLRAQPVDMTEPAIPLVEIRLEKQLDLDQNALAFSPFRFGRGIKPRGFIQAMRRPVYALSQRLRMGHSA
jgi:hypothetical protein